MAYLYLILSALCSILIAHLLKQTEVRELRTLNTLTVNYLVAFGVAMLVGVNQESGTELYNTTLYLFLFCGLVGMFFIGNFLVFSKSVHANGMGISIAAMRLSLLVPVLISIYFYSEFLTFAKITGIILVFGSLILLIPKQSSIKIGSMNAGWLLLITFLLSGFADASLKIYEEDFSLQLNESMFMGLVFFGAFIIGLIICMVRSGPLIRSKEIILGAAIGIPNLYSAVFMIYALNDIDGAVAFPVVNVLIVSGGTFLGLFRWKDRVSTRQWIGIATALIAILLLV